MKLIGIIGLGWLGKPLAKELEKIGFEVKGSTTSLTNKVELQKQGFNAFQLKLETNKITGEKEPFFENLNILVVNIPPKISKEDTTSYVLKIQCLISEIRLHNIQKVIYVSTTSVFEDAEDFPVYTEQDRPNATSHKTLQLIEAENLISQITEIESAIVRFGGLVGGERHPVFYLSGRNNLGNAKAPINLIHLSDCIRLIKAIIQQNKFNQVYHGVNSATENKADFYIHSAKKRNLDLPNFNTNTGTGKKISADATKSMLNIEFNEQIS
jgi:nucleoside-diphosphate-sugar epimerase